ncbi:sigma-54 dependent transcriptional regulator [Zhongshania sp.]|jgi:transcriptional regulator with GAF, ATPase, and Fis domain|uniref:sigma-54 interaction domain-containing protein n=1 Tax=Zhongshania sp. TaxID=1971902 RepID=UPI002A82ADC7|nr:sigma-54 dependent transcriptional regulator [Zhongshania sp.]
MTVQADKHLLALWTEAGKHAVLSELMPSLIAVLREITSIDELYLFAFNGADEWRLSGGWRDEYVPEIFTQRPITEASALETIQRWARATAQLSEQSDTTHRAALRILLGSDYDGRISVLMPLRRDTGMLGIAVLVCESACTSSQCEQLIALAEPLLACIENDQQLTHIQRLRVRAEADRQSLLGRLGLRSISENIVGADGGLKQVMHRVNQVAPSPAGVLILGETGAGKEVIARAIHERSARHNGPFLRVNCGALPPELIDSELFGHEKGSFTGALASRRGWFERAGGGTLFLDEVGELPPAAQVRLLRVLQDGIIQKVGSEHDVQVDVRVIAATHRDLPKMVQEGSFREDLWYRLAVFPIILPTLNERLDDIEDLAKHFIQRAAMRMGVPVPPLSAADVRNLKRYSWPGNIRELGSVLERAVILGHGEYLDLEMALGAPSPKLKSPNKSEAADLVNSVSDPVDESLEAVIAAHIKYVLTDTKGRVDGPFGAAKRLGINVSTLRAKLRKLGIDANAFRSSSRD